MRKVECGKLPIDFDSLGIERARRLNGVSEITKTYIFAFKPDSRLPLVFSEKVNAAPPSINRRPVSQILAVSAKSKIAPAIIEPIPISVVGNLAILKIENKSMKIDTVRTSCVKILSYAAGWRHVPTVFRDSRKVAVIDLCKKTSSEWDKLHGDLAT